jgi:hypothetical protein
MLSPEKRQKNRTRQFQPPPKKLGGEVPRQQLDPVIGGFHGGGLVKYCAQVLEGVPAIRLRRFCQRI